MSSFHCQENLQRFAHMRIFGWYIPERLGSYLRGSSRCISWDHVYSDHVKLLFHWHALPPEGLSMSWVHDFFFLLSSWDNDQIKFQTLSKPWNNLSSAIQLGRSGWTEALWDTCSSALWESTRAGLIRECILHDDHWSSLGQTRIVAVLIINISELAVPDRLESFNHYWHLTQQ